MNGAKIKFKLFTPIIKNKTQVNAQQTEHVCSFILDVVFYFIGIVLHILDI